MKIAYIGEYHPTNGTYYRQRITVSQSEYEYINKKLTENYTKTQRNIKRTGIMPSQQLETICYRKPLDVSDRNGNKIYLKLNQLYMIWSLFPDNKRFTDNNTILMIK
jgi:hypothetical protein